MHHETVLPAWGWAVFVISAVLFGWGLSRSRLSWRKTGIIILISAAIIYAVLTVKGS
jgi:hypothetical protein